MEQVVAWRDGIAPARVHGEQRAGRGALFGRSRAATHVHLLHADTACAPALEADGALGIGWVGEDGVVVVAFLRREALWQAENVSFRKDIGDLQECWAEAVLRKENHDLHSDPRDEEPDPVGSLDEEDVVRAREAVYRLAPHGRECTHKEAARGGRH